MFGRQVQHVIKKKIGPNRILGFVNMKGQKDLRSMKKGINCVENHGEN